MLKETIRSISRNQLDMGKYTEAASLHWHCHMSSNVLQQAEAVMNASAWQVPY
jgi:hypothetical protein